MNNFNPAYTGYNSYGCGPQIPLVPIPCDACEENIGCIYSNSECIIYNGENLPTINTITGDNLNTILTNIANLFTGPINPDYSTYSTACLTSIGSTDTQQQFVETISSFVCTTNTNLNTFINTTYSNYVTTTNNTITSIRIPGTTGCSSMPISNGATINQVLQILSNTVCSITQAISISSLDWDGCFISTSTPTDIYEGFAEVLRQICIVNSNITNIVQDTYKVKLNSSDTTEDYLTNKLKSSSCITINPISDSGVNKLQIGLGFTPSTYTFNPLQFDVTEGTTDGCTQNYNVAFTGSTGGGSVNSVGLSMPTGFSVSNSPITNSGTLTVTTTLSGPIKGNGSGFISGNINLATEVLGVLGAGNGGTGIAGVGTSGQILVSNGSAWVPTTPTTGGSVNSVALALPNSTFSITGSPITNSGTLIGGFISQAANTFFIGPQTGPNATPTWRTMITADIPDNTVTYAKIQQVNIGKRLIGNPSPSAGNVQPISIGSGLVLSDGGVLSATGSGGFTPNPCHTSTYTDLDTIIPGSGNNGSSALSYTFSSFTIQPSPLVNGAPSQSTPQYKFDAASNLGLLGNVTFRLTTAASSVNEDILIDFADISSFNPTCTTFNKNFHKFIGHYTLLNTTDSYSFIEVYLCYTGSTQNLQFLLKVKSTIKMTDNPLIISLDSIVIPMEDFV